MSASPSALATASTKRPLEDESSPSGPTDQPDAKRLARDKVPTEIGTEDGNAKPEPVPQEESRNIIDTQDTTGHPTENGHKDPQGDTVVPDAPNGTSQIDNTVLETQPIQSTSGGYGRETSHGPSQHQGHQDETGWLHIRAVISSAEAATVIGKGGENVSQIRRHSGAKCTVSDYSRGAVERVLTVSGLVDAAAKVRLIYTDFEPSQLTSFAGFRPYHPNVEQRTARGCVDISVEDLSSEVVDSPHFDWLDHRQVWRPHPRNSRSFGSSLECI